MGLYLYGITRAGGWKRSAAVGGTRELRRIRFRDLEAVVRPVPFDLPEIGPAELAAHQSMLGRLTCHSTVVPVPPGVIFARRRALVRFLDDQYSSLVEGLVLLEGHWEFRLHLSRSGIGTGAAGAGEASKLYGELRQLARAAVTFPRQEELLLSAAFLVPRPGWIEFVEQAEEIGAAHTGLQLDLTGPWPPYDFIRLVA